MEIFIICNISYSFNTTKFKYTHHNLYIKIKIITLFSSSISLSFSLCLITRYHNYNSVRCIIINCLAQIAPLITQF